MIGRFLFLLLLCCPAPAFAWWEYGHETVAKIAAASVTPATRRAMARLLAREDELATPACRISTVEQASVWPDCIKGLGDRFNYAFPWHYQNVDVCKPFDLAGACKDGNCVSAQIERNARLLADKALPPRERLQAFAFLVHLVGDLHMPLHAGDRGDLGGNRLNVSYGLIPRNAHAIWDGYLSERAISTPPGEAAGLLSAITADDRAQLRQGSVADWSKESWEVSRDFAYASVLGGDPCGPVPDERPTIDEAMTQRLIPVVRTQIVRGGLRLARLLDEALG